MAMERAGVLLAGGRGARMGADKALLPFRGRAMASWTHDVLLGLADEVLVMAGPDAARLAHLAGPRTRVLPDAGEGPLRAALDAAAATDARWLLVAPADAPLLDAQTYAALMDAAQGHAGAVAVAADEVQPLVVILQRAPFTTAADAAWNEGRRSMRAALDRLDLARVPLDAETLRDADTPDELSALDGPRQPAAGARRESSSL